MLLENLYSYTAFASKRQTKTCLGLNNSFPISLDSPTYEFFNSTSCRNVNLNLSLSVLSERCHYDWEGVKIKFKMIIFDALTQLLLHGDQDLSYDLNKIYTRKLT